MMKKSTISLAVAAALAAPVAQAVTFDVGDDTEFTLYGKVESAYVNRTNAAGDDLDALEDIDSEFGFKGEHYFDDAVTGFWHMEFEFDPVDGSQSEIDEVYFGLKGDFGKAYVGTHDTLYEDELAEIMDEFEIAEATEEADSGEGDQITYYSPDMNGFMFAAEARINGEADSGIGDSGTGLAGVVGYDADMWGVRAGFDNRGAAVSGITGDFEEETTTGVGGWYELGNGFEVAGRYGIQNNVDGDPEGDDTTFTGVRGKYDYGDGYVNLTVQDISPDTGDSRTETLFSFHHDLYSNLELLIEAGQYDRLNDEDDVVAVGAIYSF